jgi:ribosome maturation factor RimP
VLKSIAKTEVESKLLALSSALVEPKGFRVVDLDCRVGGRSLLRVFIERTEQKETPVAVSLENCVEVSRLLGEALENFSEIPGKFDLEVSSPGLDRRLRLQSDFEMSQGQEVQLKLVEKIEGVGAGCRGLLLSADEEKVSIGVAGKEVAVPWQNIKQANRIWKTE